MPDGYDGGWRLPVPVADMSVYLPWLAARLAALRVTISRSWLAALPRPSAEVTVVNCSGLAARALVGDDSVTPVRGQVVLVEQVGLEEWTLAGSGDTDLTYVVPREKVVVVGGTAEEGAYEPRPDPEVAQQILARARAVVPELNRATVVGHRVGLRPSARLCGSRQSGSTTAPSCTAMGTGAPASRRPGAAPMTSPRWSTQQ